MQYGEPEKKESPFASDAAEPEQAPAPDDKESGTPTPQPASALGPGNPNAQQTAPLVSHWAEAGPQQAPANAPADAPVNAPAPAPAPAARILTITDPAAFIRTPPPELKSTPGKIPPGTRVAVLDEQTVQGRKYIHVKNQDTGEEIGWTAASNGADLKQKYAASGAQHVYNVNGMDLVVHTTPDLKPPSVDVFLYFHGIGGNYASKKTRKQEKQGYEDNPSLGAEVPEGLAQSGRNMVAIFPQGQYRPEWASLTPAKYAQMIDHVLPRLSRDLGLAEPLQKGHVSLGGHSMGGTGLGPAAIGTDADDVTLHDAGYGWYDNSWTQLREWFVTGKPAKNLRVISNASVSTIDRDDNTLNMTKHNLAAKDVMATAKQHNIKGAQVTPVQPDKKTKRDGGMTLDGGFDLTIDGQLQGSLRIFGMNHGKADHWGVRDQTMAATLRAGDASDEFGKTKDQ